MCWGEGQQAALAAPGAGVVARVLACFAHAPMPREDRHCAGLAGARHLQRVQACCRRCGVEGAHRRSCARECRGSAGGAPSCCHGGDGQELLQGASSAWALGAQVLAGAAGAGAWKWADEVGWGMCRAGANCRGAAGLVRWRVRACPISAAEAKCNDGTAATSHLNTVAEPLCRFLAVAVSALARVRPPEVRSALRRRSDRLPTPWLLPALAGTTP